MDKELIRQYTLKSKDKALIDFSVYKKSREINSMPYTTYEIKIDKLHSENKNLFPKRLQYENLTDATFHQWILKRKVPKNRQFVENILQSISDNENPLKYVDVTQALSVNDAYWVMAKDFPQ